jgi:hypothetical protein
MASSGMLRRVAIVRADVSEELSASFIGVTRIGELGTMLVTASVVPSSLILVTLMKEALSSSEASVLTRTTQRNIREDAILHSHRSENLKLYNIGFNCILSEIFILLYIHHTKLLTLFKIHLMNLQYNADYPKQLITKIVNN